MGSFIIDQQTFKDLNIFGDKSDPNTIFHLFKSTRTLGAREKLRQMMLNPINDIDELEDRRNSIEYFHLNQLTLAIRNEELDLIEFYLKSNKRYSKNNILDSVSDFLTKNSSNDYYIITTGLKYLIKLSRYLMELIAQNSTIKKPAYLAHIFLQLKQIIEEGTLNQALTYNENKLAFFQVNKLDHAFRGKEKEKIQTLLNYVYELDVFENVAAVALKLNLSFPKYVRHEDLQVDIKGLFHPTLQNPVKNNISINNKQNLIFLTGTNMAGKSSMLKSISLAIYLSHLGFPVPAQQMKTTIFNGLITTINLSDDLNNGLSHYYSEVKRVKEVALHLAQTSKIFIVFDELFRGTNVKDAFDASLLIISVLTEIRSSAFLISTHIVELADELNKLAHISFKYMETNYDQDEPTFTYRIANGVSKERLGMFIVLKEGIVDILKQAK